MIMYIFVQIIGLATVAARCNSRRVCLTDRRGRAWAVVGAAFLALPALGGDNIHDLSVSLWVRI